MKFRTPITYYGGKQKLIPFILPRIPAHTGYHEIFAGGGAIFFAKPPSEIEVLNDTNKELINFYKVVKSDFVSLEKEIKITLHSRDLHRRAWVIYTNPDMFSEIKRAWAVWVLSSQSFSAMLDGSWGYDKSKNRTSTLIQTKKERFTEELAIRLQNVQIECTDALYIINSRDQKDAFFYVDPPYYDSDCGHYNGYSLQDYENLLKALSKIKGKFLLSSYPTPILLQYAKKNKWNMFSVEQKVSVNAKSGYLKRKIEVLTANYPIK
ncbi:MAG TPA: DNA adenine methylase [Chitinophagaceae bacterium]|jgi:DNA adenine methylase